MILKSRTSFVSMDMISSQFRYVSLLKYDNWKFLDLKETLREEQKENRNIYFILNDFDSKRSESDLVWFCNLWIDVDCLWDDSVTLETLLEDSLKYMGFVPTVINKTFKGFHLVNKLEQWLYYWDVDQYKRVYDYINEKMKWDLNMRSVTGILKQPWFLDFKDDRRFMIQEIYKSEVEVEIGDLERMFSEKIWEDEKIWEKDFSVLFDKKREDVYKNKILKKERNVRMFNEIRFEDFAKRVNSAPKTMFNHRIEINEVAGIVDNDTSLRLRKWNLYDFSKNKRRDWVYGYFIRVLLKWVKEENMGKVFGWLKQTFGISFNKNLELKPIYSTMFEVNLQNNEFQVEKKKELGFSEDGIALLDSYNNLIKSSSQKGRLQRVMIWLNILAYDSRLDFNQKWGVLLEEGQLLNTMGLSCSDKNKKDLRSDLLLISNLNIMSVEVNEDSWRKFEKYNRLLEFSISMEKWKATLYNIKSNFRPSKKLWINALTLQVAKKPTSFYLAISIQSKISEFWGCSLNIEKAMGDLGVKSLSWLRKFLQKLKDEKIIKKVRYTKKAVYIE